MRQWLFLLLLLLCAALFSRRSAQAQEPGAQPAATPTIDRLAAPPTVTSPTQADDGAYLYWLNCQPCHGDRGQGLTDEWRAQYPEEDQNCWNSGCHGKRPYEEGFTLPDMVPAIIGKDSLAHFPTLGQLYAYIRAAMPYEYPGVLPEDEYLAITAFLARENQIWTGSHLTEADAHQIRLRPAPAATPVPTLVPSSQTPFLSSNLPAMSGIILVLAGVLAGVGAIWQWRRRVN